MKITKLTVENFKTFKEKVEFDFDTNLIFLVGENNTGKTTVLEAISYLLDGPTKDIKYKNSKATEEDDILIEAEVFGDFSSLEGDLKKYENYIFDKNKMKIKRGSKKESITQSGKEVKLDDSKIQIYNWTSAQFENPTGKDTTFKSFLEAVFVWSETKPGDIVDFGSTKILGKLVGTYAKDFFGSELYEEFEKQRKKVFHEDENSLAKKLEDLGSAITDIFNDQYGGAKIEFNFGSIDPTSYTKAGKLVIDEGSDKEDLQYKGSGMQRAVALSIIQLFSNIAPSTENTNLILCIDEPELNLHPLAQEKLINALSKLSDSIQIFVTTHSPSILKNFKTGDNKLHVFTKQSPKTRLINEISLISWGPTISEVNYFAYNLYSREFLVDLYAHLEYQVIDQGLETNLERYLKSTKLIAQVPYLKLSKDGKTQTQENWTPISITRHKIHHGDNILNGPITEEEITDGIKQLIAFTKEIL